MSANQHSVRGLIVTVNYRSADSVVVFLDSLSRLKRFSELDVLIVDNSSGDHSVSRIREAISNLSRMELLESSTNRGYLGAARFALDHYRAQGRNLPDWVIVCNHDVVIEDEGFFEMLFACDPAAVGVLAPRITIVEQAVDQNPYMKERPGWRRRFTMQLYSAAYPLAITWAWLSRQKRVLLSRIPPWMSQSKRNGGRQPIYAGHGAFMIFSRRFFEAGGNLDDQLFLFGEEIAVAEACRALGLQIIYDPALSVLHNEHQSVGNGMSRRMYAYHREAVRHVLTKYLSS
jgi:GT2 family glycosyltransferase